MQLWIQRLRDKQMNENKSGTRNDSLIIVGNPASIHVGAHLWNGAKQLGIRCQLYDTNDAFRASWLINKMNWRFRGHYPTRLKEFSERLLQACVVYRPRWILSTGIAPIEAQVLKEIGKLNVVRINYLTDDPWNPVHHAPWFFESLIFYDQLFSPRRSNLEDLRRLGSSKVTYLPFAYAPEAHFPELAAIPEEQSKFDTDVVFAGGADKDRIPYIASLIRAGFRVALYGGYWERYPETIRQARGHADPQTLRKAICGAKVAVCLVRKSNRDGHVMRTFELPATGACMLTEYTEEHREIFDEEGKAVVYFHTIKEMIKKLKWLLENEDERHRLEKAAHDLIVKGKNTYKDRLLVMLGQI
jgi:spore maturation protein CgeB